LECKCRTIKWRVYNNNMSRAREVSKVISTVENLDAVAYSSASPSGAGVGDLWVDTSTANPLIKAYNGTGWDTLGSAPVPIITGIAPDNISGSASTAVIINGTNFESGSIVKLIDINNTELFAISTTFNNARSLQFLTPALTASAGPYDVKVTNPDNQISILENCLTVGTTPTWVTNAGSLGLIYDSARSSTPFTVQATDADSHAITYSVVSGSLPTNMTMTNQGVISGTAQAVASDTTYAFTVRATDSSGDYSDRSFSITTKAPIVQSFTSLGTTTWQPAFNGNIKVLVVGGGGSGGRHSGGGGGAGGVVYNQNFSVSSSTVYTVTVGDGGVRNANDANTGNNGQNSVFGTITALGGGGGGFYNAIGLNGGSGGGGSRGNNGGSALQPGSSSGGLGNIGANGGGGDPRYPGGGGGGAGGPGSSGNPNGNGGNGGAGIAIDITGSTVYYGGGGGGNIQYTGSPGEGGIGGGGQGGTNDSNSTTAAGQNGGANTGGGAGGIGYNATFGNADRQGKGGSGVVILRY
jgi:hypothetical protein